MTLQTSLASLFLVTAYFVFETGYARSPAANSAAFAAPPVAPPIPGSLWDRGVKRIRAVLVNNSLFDRDAAERFLSSQRAGQGRGAKARSPVLLNFFRNASLKVRWQTVEVTDGAVTWNGAVEGAPLGNATLLFNAGLVTANVTRGAGMIYQIRTASDGTVWLLEVDQKAFPSELSPVKPPPARNP